MTPEQEYNDLLLLAGKITTAIRLIPIVIFIVMWQRKINKPIKRMGLYLIAMICSNWFGDALYWSFNKYYNVFWKPILTSLEIGDTNFLNIIGRLIDYIFVGWIFSFAIKDPLGNNLKKISWSLIPIAILIYFFVDGFRTYGTVNAILNRTYLVVVPVIYFWYLFNSPPHLSLWRNSFFLFGLGLFVPNLVGLVMSFVGEKLNQTDYVSFVKLSLFRNGLTIMAQFLFALAFYYAHFTKFLEKKV
jgi:hypothetical protein